jgi:hypothetical protein
MPIRTEMRWSFPEGLRGGEMSRKISVMRLGDLGMELPLYIKGYECDICRLSTDKWIPWPRWDRWVPDLTKIFFFLADVRIWTLSLIMLFLEHLCDNFILTSYLY